MSQYDLEKRAKRIQEIRAASLLNAVFMLSHYNERERLWGQPADHAPAISLEEVFPNVNLDAYEHALKLVRKMEAGAFKVAKAFYGYPPATRSYEDETATWITENAGFSHQVYGIAEHAALTDLR